MKKYINDHLEEHLKLVKERLKVEALKKFIDDNVSIEEIEKSLIICDIPSEARAEIIVYVLEHSKR